MPPASPADATTAPAEQPVAAQYLATFLKPEMLHIYRQITALRAFRPVVLCHRREQAEAFPFEDVRMLSKPRTRALRRVWQKQILGQPIQIYRSEARQIARLLQEIRAQALHVYFGHIGVHLLPLLEISPVPVVVSFHGADAGVDLDQSSHLALLRRVFSHATLLLVRANSLGQKLAILGADRDKIRIHRTGIPLDDIPFRTRIPPPDGAWQCVQACRLIAKKGLATTLRAFAQFIETFPKATLVIAGEGPQLDELRALAATLKVADRVEFPGFLPQAELRALYARSHLFLHPSETAPDGDQEGVPNSMLEAMASGLPVVATNHGGIPEAVEQGLSGWLVAERDPAAMVNAMLALATNPRHYTQMSSAAAARVSAVFDLNNQARLLENYYREAISRRR
jgi:colanic acid/amylovoran biosynthesis glycosyltransferase